MRGGDKQVKKAVLVLAVALLAVAMLAAPVLAAKPTVTPIKAEQVLTSTPTWEKQWISDGILHRKNVYVEGIIRLYIPSTAVSPTYVMAFHNTYDLSATGDETGPTTIRVDANWIYTVDGEVMGTFEGQINWNVNGPFIAHGLLQGTGVFEGQTLKFWEDLDPAPPTIWLGTLLER